MFAGKRVLVLSPHPDDAELGAGGTLARMVEEKAEVHLETFSWCAVSGDPEVLKKEAAGAMKELGIPARQTYRLDFPTRRYPEKRQDILEEMVKWRKELQPDIVLAPCSFDVHQDHSVVCQEAMRAFKHSTLLGYEEPWNAYYERLNYFVALDEKHLQKKIAALDRYVSQKKRGFMAAEYIRSLATVRGQQINERYAEAFEVLRGIQR